MTQMEQLQFEKDDFKLIAELNVDVRYIKDKIDAFESIVKEILERQQHNEQEIKAIKKSLDDIAVSSNRLTTFFSRNWDKILRILWPILAAVAGILIDHFFHLLRP